MTKRSLFFVLSWISFTIMVFVYSYGFVDFNLTLSSHPLVMGFVSWSQRLAMFNRPLSTQIYISLIVVIFLLYATTLRHYTVAKLNQFPWKIVIAIALFLSLAYPFLSSDVFKYLFAAKELLVYKTNPHLVAPQVFEGDTWLRFMRWIHTPSPYGPVMTGLAVVYYLVGFGKFTPSLYLLKLDQAAWYLLAIYLIGKLGSKLKLSKAKLVIAQLFFALNPLVLIEWLVNSHNDAPMITLLLFALYFLSQSKRLLSLIALLFSVGIKYVTVFALPFILLKKPKFTLLSMIYSSLFVLTITPYLYHYTTQFQPWYITWIIPFVALSTSSNLMLLAGSYSLGALLRYLPYISTGLWIGTPTYFALLTYLPLILTCFFLAARQLVPRKL